MHYPAHREAASCGTRPIVSVLVPTYNYANFLPQALESILMQDFRSIEVIVSDDGSTDSSAEVVRRYARHDSRIRAFIQSENLGMVANWNWCLRQARGEFVQYLFGDDCFASPDTLSRLHARLAANPRAALAAGARVEIDSDSHIVRCGGRQQPQTRSGPALIAQCLQANRNLIGEPSAVMFRRSLSSRGFDPRFRQLVDIEMWFHLLSQGEFEHVAEPLCAFRRHARQQTAVNRSQRTDVRETPGLILRYLPVTRTHLGRPLGTWQTRRILFRAWWHARDMHHHCPEVGILGGELSTPLRIVCWFIYRVTRPWENLRAKLCVRRAPPLHIVTMISQLKVRCQRRRTIRPARESHPRGG